MRPSPADGWRIPAYASIIEAARERGLRTIQYPRHQDMFVAALCASRGEPDGLTLSKDLAPAVFAAVTGSTEPRLDLAALTYVLWVAFDVLDDVADGDANVKWPEYGPSELTVMACSLLAATAHDIAASLHDSPAVRERLHLRIARGIAEMADGQIADLADSGRPDVTADDVFAAVGGKTGAECALFAGLGAILADAPPERCAEFEQFGFEYGMANQFATDLVELYGDEASPDLANGTRTLPIVWHLETLDDAARDTFGRTLATARNDPAAVAAVRAAVADSGTLRRTLLQILIHSENARSALARAEAQQPGALLLERLVQEVNPLERSVRKQADIGWASCYTPKVRGSDRPSWITASPIELQLSTTELPVLPCFCGADKIGLIAGFPKT
jgi:geranylgeranyl pyrophosphate synthase